MPRQRRAPSKAPRGGGEATQSSPGSTHTAAMIGAGEPSGNPTDTSEDRAGARLVFLDPQEIHWPEIRVTSEYNEDGLAEMGHSLMDGGQEDPLVVYLLEDGTYEGAGGMNRCLAAIAKGLSPVMCTVKVGSHRDVTRANLRTGIQQSRPNPWSEVEAVANAVNNEGVAIEEVMADTGKSAGWVEDRLRIFEACEASPPLREGLAEGTLGIGKAALLAIFFAETSDLSEMERLLMDLQQYGWTEEQLRDEIRGNPDPPASADPGNQGGSHQVRFAASDGPREPKKITCYWCEADREVEDISTLSVCADCLKRAKLENVEVVMTGSDQVVVTRKWAVEARDLLAGSQAGSMMAQQLDGYMGEE